MRSDYGSVIHELFFQSSNNSSLKSVEVSLETNLRQFEPRIIVQSVKAERLDVDGGLIGGASLDGSSFAKIVMSFNGSYK